jgi:hypothetical protein
MMQLHKGAEHCGNLIRRGIINVAVDNLAVEKPQNYISEMSQNHVFFPEQLVLNPFSPRE